MPVTTKHPDYEAHSAEWAMMSEALVGERAVKANSANLPKPSGMAAAESIDAKSIYLYEGYTARAQYEHWVRDSLRSMMGLVSRLTPEIELPQPMMGLIESATDDSFGLTQLFLRVVRQTITHGRAPILANVDDKGNPYFTLYRPESAINWNEAQVSGRRDLTLSVFVESRKDPAGDMFSHDTITVYRVIMLRDGACVTYVTDKDGIIVEPERVLGTAGSGGRIAKALSYIPVVYAGSTDNSPDVDEVPLLSMARAALKSYQLSADYFTALHQTSHPQPWVSGLDESKALTVTGPSAAWDLGPSGECGYLEFTGAGIEAVRQAMSDQKNAALEAGAKVMDVQGTESGVARQARQNDQHATLHSIVVTAAESIEQVLRYAADWTGRDPGAVKFSVKPEFVIPGVDPQVAQQIQQAVLAGGVSWDSYWLYMTTGKLPEHDYTTEAAMVDGQTVSGQAAGGQ